MTIYGALGPKCFELFRRKNIQNFPGLCPWTPWEGLITPPPHPLYIGLASPLTPSPPLYWFFVTPPSLRLPSCTSFSPHYTRQKTGTPQKLLDMTMFWVIIYMPTEDKQRKEEKIPKNWPILPWSTLSFKHPYKLEYQNWTNFGTQFLKELKTWILCNFKHEYIIKPLCN